MTDKEKKRRIRHRIDKKLRTIGSNDLDSFFKDFKKLLAKYPDLGLQELEQILNICCQVFELDNNDVIGVKRHRPLVMARYCYAFISHKMLEITSKKVAGLINRGHSDILHYCGKFPTDYTVNDEYRAKCQQVLEKVNKTFGMSMSFEEVL